MKKCPYCGHENENGTKVCVKCKAEIPQPKKNEKKKEKE